MKIRMCLSVFAIALATGPAYADISYDQKITVDAAGAMSMMASDGKILTQVSADKSRSDSSFTMKSKFAGMFAGNGNSGSIVRLDKSLMWNLLPEKKQYSEMTFVEVKAQMDKAQKSMKDAQGSGQGGMLPVSSDSCEWTQGEVKVEHPAGTEEIAGLKTSKHTIRMQQSCKDKETAKTCDITWLMETWLATNVPGEQEARTFNEKYASALGLGDVMSQAQGPGQSLLAMFASNWKDVEKEFEKLQGYPLRTVMQMGIGGEQCTTEGGQPIAMDGVWADASTAAAAESLGDSVAGSIGGAAVGAAAGELIGGLSGMFKKSGPAAQPQSQPQSQPASANGQVTVFRITSEVTNWSQKPVPQERFDVPGGWKKI